MLFFNIPSAGGMSGARFSVIVVALMLAVALLIRFLLEALHDPVDMLLNQAISGLLAAFFTAVAVDRTQEQMRRTDGNRQNGQSEQ